MAILGPLLALLGRFAGKLLNLLLGWATMLLFGKVPADRQWVLLLVALGSIVWVVLVVGVLIPDVGVFLLAFVPVPAFVDETWVRLAMLAGATLLPLGIGAAGVLAVREADRPSGAGLAAAVLRGYPFAFVLALTIVGLAVVALVRKGRSLARGWEDAHVPVVVKPGGYDDVLAQLRGVLGAAGLVVRARRAPRVLSAPARILERVAGRGLGGLVPDELMLLERAGLEVLVYPTDIAISGEKTQLAQARAAIADRLTHAPAYLTLSEESHQVEDRLAAIAAGGGSLAARREALAVIDGEVAALAIPFDEWETLYRQRLQVERDLLAGASDGAAPPPLRAPASPVAGGDGPAADDDEASPASQLVGLAGLVTLAVYAVALVLYRLLPDRRG